MEEVRRKIQSLQGRLDEEGDDRERVARYNTVLDINNRIGSGDGLMERMGYSANKAVADQISRTRQQQNNRNFNLERGNDPLESAKSRTEQLQDRLAGEEDARQSQSQQALVQNMERARQNVAQNAQAQQDCRQREQMARRQKKEEYFRAIENVASGTRNDLLDQARLTASNEARERRATAAKTELMQAAEADGHREERETRQAFLGDGLMGKLDASIQRLEADLEYADDQLSSIDSGKLFVPGSGNGTPSSMHDDVVGGQSSANYWAERSADTRAQLEWMKRQASRRAKELQ